MLFRKVSYRGRHTIKSYCNMNKLNYSSVKSCKTHKDEVEIREEHDNDIPKTFASFILIQ